MNKVAANQICIYYSTLSQRSDVRKKENITPYTRGLQEVLQLNPVSFNWKEYNQTETQYGFIAQEVETIFKFFKEIALIII